MRGIWAHDGARAAHWRRAGPGSRAIRTLGTKGWHDGSSVSVLHGRLTALTKGKSTPLQKNQALSLKAGDPESVAVETAPAGDDFDQWVSAKIQNFTTATAADSQ